MLKNVFLLDQRADAEALLTPTELAELHAPEAMLSIDRQILMRSYFPLASTRKQVSPLMMMANALDRETAQLQVPRLQAEVSKRGLAPWIVAEYIP